MTKDISEIALCLSPQLLEFRPDSDLKGFPVGGFGLSQKQCVILWRSYRQITQYVAEVILH